jgi:hypothetical protein
MYSRANIINICNELSQHHEEVVFWKHLDRGLKGCGDIDILSVKHKLSEVSDDLIDLILSKIPGSRAVVTCNHLRYAHLHFVVIENMYPKLFEFDIGFEATRLGVSWLDPQAIFEFSEINSNGIRVLKSGALTVALLILYGISRTGVNNLKSDDYNSIIYGIRHDKTIALCFCDRVLPKEIARAMVYLLEKLEYSEWCTESARRVWVEFLMCSMKKGNYNHYTKLISAVITKLKPLCNIRHIIHYNDRIAYQNTWQEFLVASNDPNHKISTLSSVCSK